MRVCLINPARIHPKLWGKPCAYQPLDIPYVAAVLEAENNVSIIDSPTEGWKNLTEIEGRNYRVGLTNDELAAKIKAFSPGVVVVTCPFSGWWDSAFEAACTVKAVDKSIKTVLIGLHPSVRPEQCLSNGAIDFVVIGEPEQTVSELVQVLEKKPQDLREVRGIGFLKDGAVVITSPRPVIQNLDSLPFPARHLLPMKKLFKAVKERPIRGEINKPNARFLTSRGCPNNCIFCSNHIVYGRQWRGRSPENVVAELEEIVTKYHIKQVDFEDDNLTFDRKRLIAICDLIVKRGLDIEWFTPNGVRADGLDAELLSKMKASGCKRILIAPESGVQRIVNQVMHKNQDLQRVEEAVVAAKKVGIGVGCFFILGIIGETKEDMKATINYAYKLRQLGADRFYFSCAMPVYGTELYEQAKRLGYLSSKFSDQALSLTEPLIETPEFTVEEVRALCDMAIMVNPTLNSDRIKRAIRSPKKAVGTLIGRTKASFKVKQQK
jgi:anaerobic magnesium-protoporphyrin IX monomethyl ester cyclase